MKFSTIETLIIAFVAVTMTICIFVIVQDLKDQGKCEALNGNWHYGKCVKKDGIIF